MSILKAPELNIILVIYMEKRSVESGKAPKPAGPYSQGVIASGRILFISGQLPIDPSTGELVREPFSRAVEVVLNNIRSIVREAGGDLDNIVKITAFLTDLSKFQEFNEVYQRFFKPPYPARTTVQVSRLPRDSVIEIEAIAII
jgi:2-iminobutanoate/2-iminopropanoate deaminase